MKIKHTYDVIYLTTNLERNLGGLRKARRQLLPAAQGHPPSAGQAWKTPKLRAKCGEALQGSHAPVWSLGGEKPLRWVVRRVPGTEHPSSSDAESNNILWIPR